MKKTFFKSGKSPEVRVEWNLTGPERQKKIAVIGVSRGAGATFVAVSLAFLLSRSNFGENCRNLPGHPQEQQKEQEQQELKMQKKEKKNSCLIPVTYREMRQPRAGEPLVYHEAGLDRRFGGRRPGGRQPDGTGLHLHKGINWQVFRDRKGEGSAERTAAFPENEAGTWLVADSPPLDTLEEYDLVAAVISPMPAEVYAGAETYGILRDLEDKGKSVLWIVNRDNNDVNHGELVRFLKLGEWFSLPLIESSLFFRAQYRCCLPVELLEKGSLPLESLETIAEEILRRLEEQKE